MPEIPFSIRWPIAENRLLPLKDSVNGKLYSASALNIPEFDYFLSIYPNGSGNEQRGETWIFLHLRFKNVKKVEADFTFSIESANYTITGHTVYEKPTGLGYRICETKEFYDPKKKFFVDGKFTIKVYGTFKYEIDGTFPVAMKEQKWIGGELGDEFWMKDDTKDFLIITADGKEIKIHKLVFDVRSEVFTAMFNSNMKEATENKVIITDFSFNVIETALKIIYNCNFTSALSIDELMELLQFFDQYLLQELKAKVEPYLISQISASTVCKFTNYSILTNSSKLKEKCIEFLMAAFQSKTALTDIKMLDKNIALQVFENSLYQTL